MKQLAELYQRASIFAFPSLDEGFGMPVLEAMAHGVPVIASNSSALPEVCGDAAILVDPDQTDQIAAELLRLATEPDVRKDLHCTGTALGRRTLPGRQQSKRPGKSTGNCSADHYFSSSTAIFNARRNL